jgi:3-oxoacyl-[acyl-carrier-protein] synthase-1
MAALRKALALLQETDATSCVVGAVDCLIEYPVLAWLEEAGRLKTESSSSGFIPGEAAAFLVLERESQALRRGAPRLAEILLPSLAREEAPILSGKPVFGNGLAQSIRASLSLAEAQVDGMICDLNGEYYRMKEWSLALTKVFDGSVVVPELWHPAENMGDVGAASGIVFVVIAVRALARSYFSGPNVLVWASSDDGQRGSVIVRRPRQVDRGRP